MKLSNSPILNVLPSLLFLLSFQCVSWGQQPPSGLPAVSQDNPPLEYLVRLPKEGQENPPLLVLLHGYGSNEQDLFGLSSHIPEQWLVVSIRGNRTLGQGSYCWYDIKRTEGKIITNFQQEEESRKQLLALIDELIDTYHVNKKMVVVGGFSQGAIMSECIGLTAPEKIAGFACFSGRYLEEITPLVGKTEALKLVKAFVAHGSKDQMLSFELAGENIKMLKSLGISPVFTQDQAAHTISDLHFSEFLKWLGQF